MLASAWLPAAGLVRSAAPLVVSPEQSALASASGLASVTIVVLSGPPLGPWHAQTQASLAEAALADSANSAAVRTATPSLCLRPAEGMAATLPPATTCVDPYRPSGAS